MLPPEARESDNEYPLDREDLETTYNAGKHATLSRTTADFPKAGHRLERCSADDTAPVQPANIRSPELF